MYHLVLVITVWFCYWWFLIDRWHLCMVMYNAAYQCACRLWGFPKRRGLHKIFRSFFFTILNHIIPNNSSDNIFIRCATLSKMKIMAFRLSLYLISSDSRTPWYVATPCFSLLFKRPRSKDPNRVTSILFLLPFTRHFLFCLRAISFQQGLERRG